MAYLSEIIGRPVTDLDGNAGWQINGCDCPSLGRVPAPADRGSDSGNQRRWNALSAFSAVAALLSPVIPLKYRCDEIPSFELKEDDVLLSRDVLDKQIIDTDGARVVRVNDVELVRVNGTIYVSNVDVSWLGIIRRMGLVGPGSFPRQAHSNRKGSPGMMWN